MQSNEHVRDFLRYYCNLEEAPEYAVLLTGPWGSGKTWFVRDLLKAIYSEPNDYLYISLYGMQSFDDIEAEFFRQLHPLLGSKPVRLLGKLTKGILKTTINFNFDDDERTDGSTTFGVPTAELFERTKLTDGKFLVFDDLERCSIPTQDLLGYINQYVEHSGFKALLITNEKEILERDNSNQDNLNAYRRIKEKLVGRTFEIVPELNSALEYFSSALSSELGRQTIKNNITAVSDIYIRSKYKNLRMLRHSLWDFDRLCQGLNERVIGKEELLTNLLSLFLAYSFEVRSGTIAADDIHKINRSMYTSIGLKHGDLNPDQLYVDIREKYPVISLSRNLIADEIWQQIFLTGSIPFDDINKTLLQSKYFYDNNLPNWIKYWHGINLSDKEFCKVAKAVEQEWTSHKYLEWEVVLHVAGLFLEYTKAGVCHKTEDKIINESRKYIDWLKSNNILQPKSDRNSEFFTRTAHQGLGFMSKDDPAFIGLFEYVDKCREAVLIESYPTEAENLLKTMKDDADLFIRSITHSNHEDNRFYKVPILKEIDLSCFVQTLLELDPSEWQAVMYSFKERYSFNEFNKKLRLELPWLQFVADNIKSEIEKRRGKISGYTLSRFLNSYLNNAIEKLEQVEIEN